MARGRRSQPLHVLEVAADRLGRDSMRPSSRRVRSRGRAFPPPGSDTSTARPPGRRSAPHERSRRRLRGALDRPTRALPEPSLGAFDREGVSGSRTARRPTLLRGRVGRERRSAVPGPVDRGPRAPPWDVPGPSHGACLRRPRARIGGPLDPVLGSFVAAWAAERGVMLVEDREEGTEFSRGSRTRPEVFPTGPRA